MADIRSNILHGVKSAASLHKELGLQDEVIRKGGRVDVYQIAADLKVPVMFRGMDGLLGVYMSRPAPGILVTTKRPPSVQRFTCAHELGHFRMGHEESLDDEKQIGFAYSSNTPHARDIELQADAFAFTFLMPRWLIIQHIARLAGSSPKLPDAVTAYQLSLRLGCSYTATVLTLVQYKLISASDGRKLQQIQPKQIKKEVLGNVSLPDWHRDVWIITEADRDIALEVNEGDVFVTKLIEPATAGYLTQVSELEQLGFTILSETVYPPDHLRPGRSKTNASLSPQDSGDIPVGGFARAEIVARASATGRTEFKVKQARPWEPPEDAIVALVMDVAVRGADMGLSLEEKRHQLERERKRW